MISNRELKIWVIDERAGPGAFERLGDARQVGARLRTGVGVLLVGESDEYEADAQRLIAQGADHVVLVASPAAGCETRLRVAREVLEPHRPRLVFAPGDCRGREWAARLAVRGGWRLFSPALMATSGRDGLRVTALDSSGRWSRRVQLGEDETAVLTLRDGVAEARPADPAREGTVERYALQPCEEAVTREQYLPADPRTVDIRYADRLVAGGRGLGSKEGFEVLQRFADRLGAGIAASRMAVDLGWIEHARQVGQTGRTVKPDLYIACGISGASHHVQGMAETPHIVAVNTDPEAPIYKIAHLGLVADLYDVLEHAEQELEKTVV